MKRILALFLAFILGGWAAAQTKSPKEFLGYELGERFTPHHRMVAYFEHVAGFNPNVRLQYYGETYEKRPLLLAFVSSEENINNLESIRLDNLRRAGMVSGNPIFNIPITWMSYNVHGNEAVSSEAAMKTLWALVDPSAKPNKNWLKNTLVIMDPCVNPDGRDRYVNWYNQKMNLQMQTDPQAIEHLEPWPGGRGNHYFFDLNRDWAWQVQKESQQRVELYHQWMPQLHLDFHEQGVDQPYYFPPAAEPLHSLLSPFQHKFQETFGRNTAKYFDRNNWFYFTRELFDLLYPSYGDTWPMYNGAIGMTIEQGGSGMAGIGIINAEGDTLRLKDRISHHFTTGLSAIESAAIHSEMLLDEFEKYFLDNRSNPRGKYKSFVIRGNNPQAKVQKMLSLLDKNGIIYGQSGEEGNLTGYHYGSGKVESFKLAEDDIIITAQQPKSVLTQVLFEPEPYLMDSITYDITSWALPYAYGLEAFALEESVEPKRKLVLPAFEPMEADTNHLAYISPWYAGRHANFLSALIQEGIRVRYAESAFETGGEAYPAGSLIITRGGNRYVQDFHGKVTRLAKQMEITLGKTSTGYMDKGFDFGSSQVKTILAPKIALIGGEGVSSLNFGEIWHYFEQDIKYPLSILDQSQIKAADLTPYNLIILPTGSYGAWGKNEREKFKTWVSKGGKIVILSEALEFFADKEGFELSRYLNKEDKNAREEKEKKYELQAMTIPFGQREREEISKKVLGAVFEVTMDTSSALGFGTNGKYYTLMVNENRFAYLKKGVNVGIIPSMDHHRTGFVGYKAQSEIKNSLVFGIEYIEKGKIVYMTENPLFRGFWENGKLIFANAVFLVQ